MAYQETYQKWLDFADMPDFLKQELSDMDEKTKEDAFYAPLEFGTAGMRGVIGAGINRINRYVVRQATEGFAQLIAAKGEAAKNAGVVIAYDSRHFSQEFAFDSAALLAQHGIQAYVFESLRPTPELSFAVRELKAAGGIMITASHNPAEFNGYKVYGEDGGQLSPDDAAALTKLIRAVEDPFTIQVADFEAAKADGKIKLLCEEMDQKYLAAVKTVTINPELIAQHGKDLKIVYTPLHGTGEMMVRRALKQAGFESFELVEEQAIADPNFTTAPSPNPESQAAFALAEKLGAAVGADLLLGTDPDADRLGAEIRQADGSYLTLTGNQIGAVMAKYILKAHRQAGTLPTNGAICKSIVSTELVGKIAESYGVTVFNVLTGFKFVAEKIAEFERTQAYDYLFGFEESNGYLIKPFARDKDSVQAAVMFAEIAAYYRSRGMTLADGLDEIYREYGYYFDKPISITMTGIDGAAEIQAIMDKFRANAPKQFNGTNIIKVEDFQAQTATDSDGKVTALNTSPSNVLKYYLADGSWVAVRPSGTEPKIKFYISAVGSSMNEAEGKFKEMYKEIKAFIA
ncbi:phospho-sugar mutase [Neisseria sp. N95_16]|uniref:Phospho-sugar mutase n=1 Tax=Neisseria brasiliensis TaxID=2666100 RepID=A0A7X2KZ61_9NEIS|nr:MULTISPECIES: phospho-sugar mutase [Neisseria]MRN38883.1 phospho-sugar mutase [Neisseria brasiliensis]PJO10520.1 phospho-sugar mutase [Neisseria sp. N95_16]